MTNPVLEHPENAALMLRRAAEACRNRDDQAAVRPEWFSWVAPYLENLASQLASSSDDSGTPGA